MIRLFYLYVVWLNLPFAQFLECEGLHDRDLIGVVADESGHRDFPDLVQLRDKISVIVSCLTKDEPNILLIHKLDR